MNEEKVPIKTYSQWLIRLGDNKSNYPHYNFYRTTTGANELFVFELAVAGIRSDQLKVFFSKQNYLTIHTDMEEREDPEYIHKGIAMRNFKEIYKAHFSLKMLGQAHLEDGILRIIFTCEPHIDDDAEMIQILTRTQPKTLDFE